MSNLKQCFVLSRLITYFGIVIETSDSIRHTSDWYYRELRNSQNNTLYTSILVRYLFTCHTCEEWQNINHDRFHFVWALIRNKNNDIFRQIFFLGSENIKMTSFLLCTCQTFVLHQVERLCFSNPSFCRTDHSRFFTAWIALISRSRSVCIIFKFMKDFALKI